MIANLPNRTLTFFNEIDYGETEDTTNTNIDAEAIANTYLNKYGDTMHGALKINNHVRFSDNTVQTTAFNGTTVSLINDVIDRIAEIDVSGNITQIPIIESDNIIFPTGIQTIPFTDDDKTKLNVFRSVSSASTQQSHRTHYLNQTNLLETVGYIGGNGSGTQMTIVTYNNKPFVMHSDNYVDAWTPDFYVGRTSEAGTIHIRSGLEGDGARIYMNGGVQKRAFDDNLYDSILNSNEWNDQIVINDDDTVFTKPIILNEALTFSDLTVQTTAFNPVMITDLSNSIVLNAGEIDDIKTSIEVLDDLSSSIIINAIDISNIKTSIEVIDDLSNSIVLNTGEIDDIKTSIEVIDDLSSSIIINASEIDDIKTTIAVIDDLSSSIIDLSDAILINTTAIDNIKIQTDSITDLSNAILINKTEIDNIKIQTDTIIDLSNAILTNATDISNIKPKTDVMTVVDDNIIFTNGFKGNVMITDKLIMDDVQNYAYSNNDRSIVHAYHNRIIQPTFSLVNAWWITGMPSQFVGGVTYNDSYELVINELHQLHDYMRASNQEWNVGKKVIRIHYTVSFRAYGSNVHKFRSRIKNYNSSSLVVSESLYQGVYRKQGYDFSDYVLYSGELTFEINDGDTTVFETDYILGANYDRTFTMDVQFSVVEV
jgi:hypothetical protein